MESQQAPLNVDISQTTEIHCSKCGNPIFVKALRLRKLSSLMSPTGQEAIIPMDTLVCGSCGKEWNEQDNQMEKKDGNKNNESPEKRSGTKKL